MTVLEEEGRTPEEAVEAGLQKLALGREYVLVEVLDEGTKGFLGLGGRTARVRLTVTPTGNQILHGRRLLQDLLRLVGVSVEISQHEVEGVLSFELKGEDAGLLIGKQGQTLDSINFLISRILSRQLGERTPVQVDVEEYRGRRKRLLVQRALKLAEQVKTSGEAAILEPMSPLDRRTIHLTLQHDPGVRTSSDGQGSLRRLVISPVPRRA
ncbi:MAG: Jag N-terminal domain-containing protein [Candidatus Rokubacteria bacterium]|nr:Jag N-terminal domain-containing protein [Candidatus Rokubacteria bacterium]